MMRQHHHRYLVISAALVCLSAVPASADSTKDALEKFGWEGTWAVDCSLSPSASDATRFKMRAIKRYHVIPALGAPTETGSSDILQDINKITSAVIVRGTENVLRIHYKRENQFAATEADEDYVMRNGKLLVLEGFTVITPKSFMPPGQVFLNGLEAGKIIKWKSISMGRYLNTDGVPIIDALPLERCDGSSS